MRRLLLVAALLGLNGCAYYNGMYNANRLAGRAEKAERDGRTFDASNFWGQVVVKADSVLARHPDSKWADDARLLRGRGLARLDRCDAAVPDLVRAQQEMDDLPSVEQAALELGRCRLQLGDLAGAQTALEPLLQSADAARRAEGRVLAGRARVAAGDYEQAIELLEGSTDSTVAGDRLLALAGAGRLQAAGALADTLIAAGSLTAPWPAFLREVGEADPALASTYVDRLDSLPLDASVRARWLLNDARRHLEADPDRALQRLAEAELRGPDTEAGVEARELRLRVAIARLRSADSLGPMLDALTRPTGDVMIAAPAEGLRGTADLVRRTVDSARSRPANADLMLFLAGELARDSLRAPRLTADIMRRLVREWPESPYAPKALLVLMALDPAGADSTREDLETLYGASPYVAVLQGISDTTYQALEDSLGQYAVAWRAAARTPVDGAVDGRAPRVQRPTPVRGDAGRERRPGAGLVP